jgi:hypothetical protein
MNILEYVRSLAPVYERKEVLATLQQLQEELRDYTLPVGRDMQEVFAGENLKSHYAQALTKALRKRVMFQGNGVDLLVQSLEQLENNIPVLEKETKRLFSFQFTPEKLTYDRANLLRYIEAASFYVRYFRKMALRLVAEEALVRGSATPMSWARAEREWLDEGLRNFAGLYKSIAQSESNLKQTLTKTSNAEIDEATHAVAESSIGNSKLDPMSFSQFAPNRNPLFALGKAMAEMKVKRFQASKEEHQALQFRLQELREIEQDGKTSPKLQKLIKHTEQRVEQLDYRITKIEEENQMD